MISHLQPPWSSGAATVLPRGFTLSSPSLMKQRPANASPSANSPAPVYFASMTSLPERST
jgi:hypothetical protein